MKDFDLNLVRNVTKKYATSAIVSARIMMGCSFIEELANVALVGQAA
jgi:hypothetical protein